MYDFGFWIPVRIRIRIRIKRFTASLSAVNIAVSESPDQVKPVGVFEVALIR